jgi:hypothetical protein
MVAVSGGGGLSGDLSKAVIFSAVETSLENTFHRRRKFRKEQPLPCAAVTGFLPTQE